MRPRFEQTGGLPRLAGLLAALLAAWPGGVGLLAGVSSNSAHAEGSALEGEVKAAYIDKLPQFVHWPAPALASGYFVLCVVGEGPAEPLLGQAVAGDSVQQHPIVVRRLDAISASPGCQMIFIDGEPPDVVARVLTLTHGKPILTVTNDETKRGAIGIVNFVLVDGRVRFQVNRAEAAASGLEISSKLLSVAADVVP